MPTQRIPFHAQTSQLRRTSNAMSANPLPELTDEILCNIFQYFSCTELLQLSLVMYTKKALRNTLLKCLPSI